MRQRAGVRLAVALSFLTVTALAAARPAAGGVDLAVEGQGGYFSMTASNSASAIFGSNGGGTFGGAARATVWHGLFITAGARTFSKSGERVFVASPGSPVQKLGFPVDMTTTPIFFQAGYRFLQGGFFVPYLAVGGAVTKYKETSTVAGLPIDVNTSKGGFVGSLGVEVGRGLLRFAAEGGISTAPNGLPTGGVAQVYNENDAGGKYVIGKVIIAFHVGGK
ncbi:MAG TPA: hypothetical protein VEQ10_01170 [Vicinamibacteria bacterium]|nr:hypothetical protein [Vicinamibacteria bacterium]